MQCISGMPGDMHKKIGRASVISNLRGCLKIKLGIETAKVFRTSSLRKLEAYPKSLRLLEKYRDVPKCIVSNAQRVFTKQELRFLGLYDRFNFGIISSDHRIKKPDTRLFSMAFDRLGFEPWEVLSIGDTPENDIYPPQSLGMNAMHTVS